MKKNLRRLFVAVAALFFTTGASAQIFSEDFTGVVPDEDIAIEGWSNEAIEGTRLWIGKEYGENFYAQFSAYNSGETVNEAWLVTPGIDLDGSTNEVLKFITKSGYYKHDGLSVFVSTDFTGTVGAAMWTELDATFAAGPDNGYSDWIESGNIDLSSYSGTIFIGFKYLGGDPDETTTFQVDDVVVMSADAIENIESVSLNVYPNPATSVLNIDANDVNRVVISSITGQKVMVVENSTRVNISDIPEGIYFVTVVDNNNNTSTSKFVKK
ncbi:MAG: choice-of-anchor J domain-containing protein [Bacteroidota bacterium]|nr:choice-of-anchor J domain-containing protein [Bacteroidota bacterium]